MEKLEIGDQQQPMNEEDVAYFIKGLKIAIKQSGLTQAAFAEGVTSSVNLSNILRGETGTSEKMREALARRAGKDVYDIVRMGERADTPKDQPQQQAQQTTVPGVQTGWIDPMDVSRMASATTESVMVLAQQSQRETNKKRYWRAIFDELPIIALVLRDRNVLYQNLRSSNAWGNILDTNLCDSCACPDDCRRRDECPAVRAMETRNEASGRQFIGNKWYLVSVSPLRYHYDDHEYFVVVATETEEYDCDRRSGADRRSEK